VLFRSAAASACGETVSRLQAEIATRAISRKSIKSGDLVTVRYRDGCKDYIFEGLDDGWFGGPLIRLRAFTAKGKPCKQVVTRRSSIIPFIDRKEKRNG
jgi:hypothetical protein